MINFKRNCLYRILLFLLGMLLSFSGNSSNSILLDKSRLEYETFMIADSISPPILYGYRPSQVDSGKCAINFQVIEDSVSIIGDTIQSIAHNYLAFSLNEHLILGDSSTFYLNSNSGLSAVIGLSDSLPDGNMADIDCGMQIQNNTLIKVLNASGSSLEDTTHLGNVSTQTRFKIYVDSGEYRFYSGNQEVFSHSSTGLGDTMYLNIAFTEQGQSLHSLAMFKDCPDGSSYQRQPEDEYELLLASKGTKDGVKIRWIPRDYLMLKYLRTKGVDVYRYTIAIDSLDLKEQDILDSYKEICFGVLPASSAEINASSLSEDKKEVARDLIARSPKMSDPNPSLFQIGEHLQAEENLSSIYSLVSFSDWELTEILGLGLIDTSAVVGEEYRYLVQFNAIDLSYATEVIADTFGVDFPTNLKAEGKDHLVYLTMDLLEFGDHYSGVYLEKRVKNSGAPFQRASDLPIVPGLDGDVENFNIYDTLPDNQTVFEYRVQGIDYFGGLSTYSNIVEVKGVDPPLDIKPIVDTVFQDTALVGATIQWLFPDSLEAKIYGYNVYVTKKIGQEYKILNDSLIQPSVKEWVHDSVYYLNHYFVEAIDENEHSLLSMAYMYQPLDSTPPALPSNISGKIYKSGKVSIEWDPSPSEDLQFYKVYFSYDSTGGFTEISGEGAYRNRFYGETDVQTMTRKAYVSISAIDYHENESELTDPVELKIPDLIPPNKPILTSIRAAEEGVFMKWMVSSSEDVESHELQRQDATNNGAWISLETFGKETILEEGQFYIDSILEESTEYAYRIIATDSSGNWMPSIVYYITSVTKFNPLPFTSFGCDLEEVKVYNKSIVNVASGTTIDEISANITANIFVVSWEYPDSQSIESFTLYRAAPGRPFIEYGYIPFNRDYQLLFDQWNKYGYSLSEFSEMYTSLLELYNPNGHIFLDPNIIPERKYQYKVVANFSNGMQSRFSNITSCVHN